MDLSKYLTDFSTQLDNSTTKLQKIQIELNQEKELNLKLMGVVEALNLIIENEKHQNNTESEFIDTPKLIEETTRKRVKNADFK